MKSEIERKQPMTLEVNSDGVREASIEVRPLKRTATFWLHENYSGGLSDLIVALKSIGYEFEVKFHSSHHNKELIP